MKTTNVEITTQTSVGVKIGILIIMAAALTIAAGIIAGSRPSKKEPVVEGEPVVVTASVVTASVSSERSKSPFISNQVLVKFKTGVDQPTAINNVLSKPHTVTVDVATQDVVQEFQSKEYRTEETSLSTETSSLSTTSSTSSEDILAIEYEETTSQRIAIETETKQITLSLQEATQLFPVEADYETTKSNYPDRALRIPAAAIPPQNIEGWQKITVDQQADIGVLVDEFNALTEVEIAQPNYIYQTAVTPNDYFYNTSPPERTLPKEDLWGLKEIGIEKPWGLINGRGDIDEDGDIDGDDYNLLGTMISTNGPYPDPITIADVNNDNNINVADPVYLLNHINDPIQYPIFNYSDNEVIVAVSDTGVDYNHEDLAENIWINEDSMINFGGNGVIGASESYEANAVAIDSTFMYVVGYDAVGGNWRIEKRTLATSELATGFGYDCSTGTCVATGDGAVLGFGDSFVSEDIAIDSNYMYVVGFDDINNWRIEKRLLSDGSLEPSFGSGGIVLGDGSSNRATGVAIDSNNIYVVGNDENDEWRIEKRDLVTGALVTAFDGDGKVIGDSESTVAHDIAIDSNNMYVIGVDATTVTNWRIEKRDLVTGALVTAFDGDGKVISDDDSFIAKAIAIDSNSMYIVGSGHYGFDEVNQRIEKRDLVTGALVTAFDGDGIVIGDDDTFIAEDIAIDAINMYVLGYSENVDWRIEKRDLTTGDPVTGFGYDCLPGTCTFTGDGVIAGDYMSFRADGIAIDGTHMYIAGIEESSVDTYWHMEKYSLADGSVDPAFGTTNGIIDSDSSSRNATNVAKDQNYLYVVGRSDSDDWRIEKRRLSNGVLCTDTAPCNGEGFGDGDGANGDGIITGVTESSTAEDIAIDSTYMYVVGYDGDNTALDWRIEKRLLSDGTLEPSFGSSGVVIGDSISYMAKAISIDNDYMYIAGWDSSNLRIEKRRLSDGSLCTDASPCDGSGFGYDHAGVYTGDGIITGHVDSAIAEEIIIDSTYLYAVGGDDDYTGWRIEKRLLSDGSLEPTFGTGGVVIGEDDSRSASSVAIDSNYMYVIGSNTVTSDDFDWRTEKRLLSDGSLEPTFGTGGVVISAPESRIVNDIAIDSKYMYLVGQDPTFDWRTEKRLLSDGSLEPTFGPGGADGDGVLTSDSESLFGYGVVIDFIYMYIVGENNSNDWRIEKRQLTTGSLGNAGNVHGWDFVECDEFVIDGCNLPRSQDYDPMDDKGHGTHVAGIIAAQYSNSVGVASVCPHCTIMPVKAINKNGRGLTDWLANSIRFAADNGADVVNMSWVKNLVDDTVLRNAVEYAHGLGVVLVAAAGNDSLDIYNRWGDALPARFDQVIAVGAVNKEPGEDWARSDISNWGRKIDASAPGEDILSTVPITSSDPPLASEPKDGHTSGYRVFSGTSMATPHVAGLAALMLAYDPSLTSAQVKGKIMSTVEDIPNPTTRFLKHGVINPYDALTAPDKSHTLYFEHTIDDSAGNNDGKTDPGETVNIILTLKNYGLADATNVSAAIYLNDPCVTFINDFSTYSIIPHNQIADNTSNAFQLSYGAECPAQALKFDFNIFTGNTILETAVIDSAPTSEGIATSNNSVFYTEYWTNPSTFNRCDENLDNCEVLLSKPAIKQYYNVGVDKPTGDLLLTDVGVSPRQLLRFSASMNPDDTPLEVWDDIGYLLEAVGNKNGDLVVLSAFRYVSVFEDRADVHIPQTSPWNPGAGSATHYIDFGGDIEGIDTDDQYNIYVADAGDDSIKKYDQDLNFISSFSIEDPVGVQVQGSIVYVTTYQHQLITLDTELNRQINVFGVYGVLGTDVDHLNLPKDVAVIGNNVYISDYNNGRILQLVTDWFSDDGDFLGVHPIIIPTLGNWPIIAAAAGVTDSWSTPLLVNLDADADLEVVITIKDNVYAFNPDESAVPGWPLSVNGFTSAAMPIIGSFDGDSEPEIAFGTMIWTGANPDENKLYVVNHDGTNVSGWPITLPGDISHAAAIGNLDADGEMEIVVGIGSIDGATNKIMAFNSDGSIVTGWDKTLDANTFISDKSPVIADLNEDGNNEVILAGNGQVYIWNGDGSDYGACVISPPADNNILTATAVANIDLDPNLEIVFGSTNGLMYALNDDCTDLSGWPVNNPTLGPETPVIGDLDYDGDMEIVMPAPLINGINAWHHDGTVVSGWPTSAVHVYKVSLADLDGNNTLEVLAGTNPSLSNIVDNAFLEAWYHNGVPVAGFPIEGVYNTGVTQPVVGNINITQDSTLEIVTGEYLPDGDNQVHIFSLPHTGNIEWPTFQNTIGLEGTYFSRCTDGTVYNQCNISQQYCDNGTLTNNCRQCGYTCPSGKTCSLSGVCYSSGGGGGGGTCFLPGTPILLPNDQSKPIEQIKVGDTVIAFDETTSAFKPSTVINFFQHVADNYLIINDNLKVTPNHEVYSNGAWVEIGELEVGDTLVDNQGNPIMINSINIVEDQVTVYNLEVDEYHTYVAGGVVVHNKKQQFPNELR